MKRARHIAMVIVALYFVVLAAGHTSFGLTDDDDFYVPAGVSYVDWIGRALTFDREAWTRRGVDAAFNPNHEHPPVAKYVFGLCRYAFGFLGPTDASRMGTVLFSTLIAALLMWLAMRHFGRHRGLFAGGLAVLFLLTLPRFHFHSHAATLDVPVAAMYLATAALALAAERSRRAAIWCGVVFGLASATKLNAPFLVVPYLIFAFAVRRGAGRAEVRGGESGRTLPLPNVPLAAVTMATIGPLVFLASWPWLWNDTVKRVGEYVQFHLNHYGIYFLYFGRVYDKAPFAPWHAMFTMAAITVPVAITALALVGIYASKGPILYRLKHPIAPDDDDKRAGDLLLFTILNAVVSIAVVAFSGGAKYGGAKLFMPFFPFWCLLAGYGGLWLYERAEGKLRRVALAVLALALISTAAQTIRFGPYALSQYNAVVGGLRGATTTGFERQYYDIAFRDLVDWLNVHAPKNARVHFLPNNWEYVRTYKWYRAAGDLRKDIQVVNTERSAQLVIVTHERRFLRYGSDLMRYRTKEVLEEKVIDGVPIWTVVRR